MHVWNSQFSSYWRTWLTQRWMPWPQIHRKTRPRSHSSSCQGKYSGQLRAHSRIYLDHFCTITSCCWGITKDLARDNLFAGCHIRYALGHCINLAMIHCVACKDAMGSWNIPLVLVLVGSSHQCILVLQPHERTLGSTALGWHRSHWPLRDKAHNTYTVNQSKLTELLSE